MTALTGESTRVRTCWNCGRTITLPVWPAHRRTCKAPKNAWRKARRRLRFLQMRGRRAVP